MATTAAISKVKISGGSFLIEERRPDEIFSPEDFSEQHQLIGQTAEEFAINEIVPNIEKIEHKDFSVTRDLLKKAGELGLSSAEIPEAYGGLEMDKVTAAVIARDDAASRDVPGDIRGQEPGQFLLDRVPGIEAALQRVEVVDHRRRVLAGGTGRRVLRAAVTALVERLVEEVVLPLAGDVEVGGREPGMPVMAMQNIGAPSGISAARELRCDPSE